MGVKFQVFLESHFKRFLSANVLVALLGIVTGILLARNLSVDDRGGLAQIILWTGFGVTIGSESLREYYLSFNQKNIRISIWAVIVSSLISITLPLALLLDNGFGEFVVYALLFSIVNILSIIYLTKIQSTAKFSLLSQYRIVVPSLNLLLLLVIVNYEVSVWYALIALLVSNFALLILLFIKEPFIQVSKNTNIKSYLTVLFSVIIITVINQMDRLIIAGVSDSRNMAYFIIALTIVATPLTIIGQSVAGYIVIDIKKQKNNIARYIDLNIMKVLAILGGIAGIIYFLLPWVISLFFGEKYLPAMSYGILCASLAIFSNVRSIYNAALRGLGLNKLVSLLQLGMLSTLVMVFITYINIELGIKSTLWMLLIMQLIVFILFNLITRRYLISDVN